VAPAQRIVPASATAVDLVVALVDPGRIAGFPVQALEYSTLHGEPPVFAAHPRFDSWLAEPVLALAPDLVVVDAWNAPDTNARLAEAGVRVHAVREVRGFEDACAALRELAAVVGAEERAEALIAELEARTADLVARAEARGPRPRALCYSNFGASGWSAGAGTTVDEVMRLAGCANLVAEAGERGHVELDFERLLVLDPDLILVSRPLSMGEGPAGDRGGASEAVLLSEPSLAGLRAVRDGRIVRLPAWLYATGSHEIVTAAEFLADELDRLAGAR
jgi:iron complex transport system substrate-binding protein